MTGVKSRKSSSRREKIWPIERASNIVWSNESKTIGLRSGENVYFRGKSAQELHQFPFICWHGLNMRHMFKNNVIATEPYDPGHVSPSELEVINIQKKPFIRDNDYLEPIECPELLNNSTFLQKIILLQEKAIEELQARNSLLYDEVSFLTKVFTYILLYT